MQWLFIQRWVKNGCLITVCYDPCFTYYFDGLITFDLFYVRSGVSVLLFYHRQVTGSQLMLMEIKDGDRCFHFVPD